MEQDRYDSLAVIIPMKNEEHIASSTIDSVLRVLRTTGISGKLICVDDGSTDKTWSILSERAVREPDFLAIKLSRNFGHDAALFAGMTIADSDAVITMDADGQHPFHLVPEIVAFWREKKCSIVNCIKRDRGDETARYSLFAKFFSFTLSQALGTDMNNATEFKLLDRRAVAALLSCKDSHVFYRALAPWIGYHQEQFEFDVLPSMRGHSSWNMVRLMRFAVNGLVNFSDLPLRILIYTGLAAIFASALLLIKLLVSYAFFDVPQGYTTLLTVSLLNLGAMMTGLGIVGIYTRATLVQSLGRPRWLIETIKFSQGDDK